ncbi:MAG: hypothetical protein Q8P57_02770 [Candidatus Pacearchaeota archaeon]|nr:hypothetical protein [Candidatus Pacearchaeota archaeon]
MKKIWLILILIFLIVLFVMITKNDSNMGKEIRERLSAVEWDRVRENDVAKTSGDFGIPIMVSVSDENWEDGVYISENEDKLYFTYYPGEDFFYDFDRGNIAKDLDVYVSSLQNGQFNTRSLFSAFFLSEDIWSEGGVMISGNDIYYQSNRPRNDGDIKFDDDIYRNDERLAFNNDKDYRNPHYCERKDELYFDEGDKQIFVLKDAVKNNFQGIPEKLGSPINVNTGISAQPFLTLDCQTMYFITNRGDTTSKGPVIYKSERNEDTWEDLKPILWSKIGVGEPTLTGNEKILFFVQIFEAPDGRHTSDIFYVNKI